MTGKRAEASISESVESPIHPVTPSPCHRVPPPPWHLTGTAIVLPLGWRGVLSLVHYETSPVGPYDELAVGVLTRRGPSVAEMGVTSEASRQGGRKIWGFPKELRPLSWQRHRGRVIFKAGHQVWRVRPWGPSCPVSLPFWTVQTLDGHPVRVPCHVQGRARLAFQGRRWALIVENFEMVVAPPVAFNPRHATPDT